MEVSALRKPIVLAQVHISCTSFPLRCEVHVCFLLSMLIQQFEYRQHVYSDLMAYCCLSEHCPASGNLFPTKRSLTQHDLHFHARTWACNKCNLTFNEVSEGTQHYISQHPELQSRNQIEAILKLSERAADKPFDTNRDE